jgi:hypothetical protein
MLTFATVIICCYRWISAMVVWCTAQLRIKIKSANASLKLLYLSCGRDSTPVLDLVVRGRLRNGTRRMV